MPEVFVGVVVDDELLHITGVYRKYEQAEKAVEHQEAEMREDGYDPESVIVESHLADD